MPWLHSAALVVLNAKLGLKLRNVETGPNVLINLYFQQISCVMLKKNYLNSYLILESLYL